ncbi:meiosis protein [Aspergillus rambellii]|uniref:Meiosis protein n=2 Tax=Aspergillus subgen. Nidulantes TaxID=2720870 RepID=A0A0F8XNI2_9EURO|nr:meiosis protein [Aspergillus rambellii]KKK26033.1 meiosis protein [Aspergillus ochraceoroseus]
MRATDSSRGLSSPCSTDGVASPNGSPDTKLTAFSPEDVRSKGRSDSSVCGPLNDSGFRRLYSSSDPFLVPNSMPHRAQLSPTAASFTPIGMAETSSGNGAQLMAPTKGINFLPINSSQISNVGGGGFRHEFEGTMPAYGPIGNAQIPRRSLSFSPVRGQFDKDRNLRALLIENVPTNLTYMSLAGFFNRREFTSLKGPILSELSSMGKIYLAFTDCREAKKAIEKVHLLRPEWHVFPLTPREFTQHSDPSRLPQTSDYEGQLLASVYYDSRNPTLSQHAVSRSLETLVMTFGDIKTFTPLPSDQENIIEFHIEFFNTRDAENVMTTLNGTSVDDCVVEVSFFTPDVQSETYPSPQSPCSVKGDVSCFDQSNQKNAPWTSPRPARGPYMELSPTGRSTIPPGEHAGLMDWMTRSGERILPSPRREAARYPDLRLSNQNAVDIERIRLGLDVRTTIMLRNIPNKIDQTMLKAIVDETSHGKYDFMYLRIDFANNCNVGYAFINFEDPIDIIDFVKARAGRTWNCFNSDKVAEVSYATIQGKDCLVQKFRNSSVMLEHPSFRPKIFHTGPGPLMGTEDRFPGPDNPSKMRRSIENAEHVGLFAPRVGQQYRDEQRRRRSQFDRGTTAAEREIVYVRTLAPRRSIGINNGLKSAPCTYPGMRMWYDSTADEHGPKTS